ncbi:MAG: DUF2207 domain-containing protein [Clostridiales bacterium]|nr:DUF2207 domain-containing protein [Clostridiales bacterium]
MKFWEFIICIIISAATVVFAVTPYIIGKVKLKRAMQPLEFYPPRGYSPIDVMSKYCSYNTNPRSALNPLMLYWASRGFITIEEDCKRGLKLTKLKELTPPDVAESEMTNQMKNNFKIEKELFDGLFEGGIELYTLAAPTSLQTTNNDFVKKCKEKAYKRRTKNTKLYSALTLMSAVVSLILVTIINGVTLGGQHYIAMLFPIVAVILFKAIPNEDSLTTIIKYPFICVWGGAPLGMVLALSSPDGVITICVAVVASLITVWFSMRIDIRSDRDVRIYGRICAFKQFLLDAEKDRLETLIEENPNYYFDILPYCYILNITKKLKEKFDNITTDGPSWYLGELRDTLMF